MGEVMGSGGVIAQTIQLALAPVFVLVAIGNIMNILSQRLGRVVDRSRVLQQLHGTTSGDAHDAVVREIRTVDRRIAMISRAILLLVLSGLHVGDRLADGGAHAVHARDAARHGRAAHPGNLPGAGAEALVAVLRRRREHLLALLPDRAGNDRLDEGKRRREVHRQHHLRLADVDVPRE